MNSDHQTLRDYLAAWDRRRRTRQAALWMPRGVLAGLTVAGLLVLASRLQPLLTPLELTGVVLGVVLLSLVVTLAIPYLRRRSLLEQARYADRELRLKERATTAVQIDSGIITTTPALAFQQLQDALSVAGRIDPQADLPVRFRRGEALAAAAMLLFLLALIWLPNAQNTLLQFNQAVENAISSEASGVGELVDEIEQNEAVTPPQREALTEPLVQAQETLAQPNLEQAEAVAALSEAEAELRELAESFDQTALQAALENAADGMSGSQPAEALSEAFAGGDIEAAAQAAEQLANVAETLDPTAQQELAADLRAAAEALAGNEPELAETFQEAARALDERNQEAASDALQESAAALAERAARQAAATQAQAAADQLQSAREAVAQAGSDASQPTDAAVESSESQSDASAAGPNSAQDGMTGSGNASSEGASNAEGGAQSGDDQSAGTGQGGGRSATVFVPPLRDLSGEAGIDVELPANCLTDPASCGPPAEEQEGERQEARRPEGSGVPYQDVFGDYSEAAYEALDSEYIPLGLQDLVRSYFSSLEP